MKSDHQKKLYYRYIDAATEYDNISHLFFTEMFYFSRFQN